MKSETIWILAEPLPRDHIAQLYSEEKILTEALGMFVGYGLRSGEAVILMMTEPHRSALMQRLETDAFDLERLQRDGQLTLAGAEEMLPRFMVDGMPDPTLFKAAVGGVIAKAKADGRYDRVRVFGEMVDLLWRNNLPAAVRLEQMWDDLIEAYDISLFCAYSVSGSDARHHFPQTLCAPHSHMILSAIVESSEDAIVGRTLDAKIVSWNRGAERIYGYTADEVMGQPISCLLPPGHEDDVLAIVERTRRGEKVEHYETKRRRKDGTVIDVSLTVSPIISRTGEIIGVSAAARDITERRQAEEALRQLSKIKEAQAIHRLLLERALAAQEEEKRRIARELHDEAGQLLTSLLVGLRALEDAENLADARAQGARLRQITAQAIDEVGRIARGLHPAVLDDHGLGIALRRYVAEYSKVHNIAVDLTFSGTDPSDLPPAVQTGLYRIIQEALTNLARHSGAKAASIVFALSATTMEITVTDDGCGFDTGAATLVSSDRLGIHNMRERAAMLGGDVRFRSDGTGTAVIVHIPLTLGESWLSSRPRSV